MTKVKWASQGNFSLPLIQYRLFLIYGIDWAKLFPSLAFSMRMALKLFLEFIFTFWQVNSKIPNDTHPSSLCLLLMIYITIWRMEVGFFFPCDGISSDFIQYSSSDGSDLLTLG